MKDSMQRSGPLKPEHPLASIVFSDTGRVSQNIEQLPRTQKDRELAIATKFVRSLKRFRGIDLYDIEPDEGQADFLARFESGDGVLIQVARVIDQSMRRINEQRVSYLERLGVEYSDLIRMFLGCRLSIVDSGSEPLLPRVDRKEGIAALSELAAKLSKFARDIETLAIGKIRSRNHKIGPGSVVVTFMCERVAAPEADVPAQLSWTGGYVPHREYREMLLAEAVRSKIALGYSKPEEDYWLLLYSSDIIPRSDDAEVAEAKTLLDTKVHPFDQVWFLFPYANQELGHLVKVWPG